MIAGFGSWSATIGPASSTAPGYVTTSAQTFAGVKTFTDGIAIGSTATPTLTLNATTTTIGTITFAGAASNDTGTNPIGVLNARIGTSTSVATRPLFAFQNNGTTVAQITTAGTIFGAANSGATTSYGIQAYKVDNNTSGTRVGIQSYLETTASGSSSAELSGVYGRVATQGSQNYTHSYAAQSFKSINSHTGSGTLSGSVNFYAGGTTNIGGGTITNWYGLYVINETDATNNWGVYVDGPKSYFGGIVTFNAQANLKSYTVATLPSAATAGGFIYVSNEAGGATPAFSDATNWRRCTDLTIVS